MEKEQDMDSRVKEAVTASFVADALALGVHWVYDIALIKNKYGRLEQMVAPELAPYHKTKEKGQFTHYGDQALVLLESLAENNGFDPDHFSRAWQALFENYGGYYDGATKETLHHLQMDPKMKPSGSLSFDMGGAARIAPLALFYAKDIDRFVSSARAQTAMTHNQSVVTDTARFFALTAAMVLDGEKPTTALEKSLEKMADAPQVKQLVTKALDTGKEETTEVTARFGQMCAVEAALPSCIHLIVKYEQDLKQALIENIMAGGDSSARGMLAGFIIGAYQGLGQIPKSWLNDMQAFEKIKTLMDLAG